MPKGYGYDEAPKKASGFKMKGWTPFKKEEKKEEKVSVTYTEKGDMIKTKGGKSSTYKIDKVVKNKKTGDKTVTYKNELGNVERRVISNVKKN